MFDSSFLLTFEGQVTFAKSLDVVPVTCMCLFSDLFNEQITLKLQTSKCAWVLHFISNLHEFTVLDVSNIGVQLRRVTSFPLN